VELVDTHALGACALVAWRFKSFHPHQLSWVCFIAVSCGTFL